MDGRRQDRLRHRSSSAQQGLVHADAGKATELFYPLIDTPSVRDSQLVVSDGRTFTDREDKDTNHSARILDRRGLTYRVVNTAKSGDYRIVKTYVTDPATSTVLVDIRFVSLTGMAYDVYVLHDPALGNDGTDDTARGRGSTMLSSQNTMGSAGGRQPGPYPRLERIPRHQ